MLKTFDNPCSDKCTGPSQCKTTEDDREPGWNCSINEECVKVKDNADFKTLSACEQCCPSGSYLHCRKANFCGWPFQPSCSKKYCKRGRWCLVDPGDQCSALNARCIACNKTTGQCSYSVTRQDYTSLDTCKIDCPITVPLVPCSVTAIADPNPVPAGQNQTTISATNFSHTSIDKCKVIEPIPQTFTQTVSSQNYQVSCTGDSGYDDCRDVVTVTRQSAPTPTSNPNPYSCKYCSGPSGKATCITINQSTPCVNYYCSTDKDCNPTTPPGTPTPPPPPRPPPPPPPKYFCN